MFGRKLAIQTASSAQSPALAPAAPAAPRKPVPARSALGLAGTALLFLAAAAALLAARGNPYDGAPVVRVRVSGPLTAAPPAMKAPVLNAVGALEAAPIAGLTAPGPGGLLPIIAADGRASWKAYARPFTDDGRPKIALVIGGLGLNPEVARAAIAALPPEVTLSFSPMPKVFRR